MIAASELKMLLLLNGKIRIPHLEHEIFSSSQLRSVYLTLLSHTIQISSALSSEPEWHESDYALSHIVLFYATQKLKCRWKAAEDIVLLNAYATFQYSVNIISGRWIEGEYIIRKHSHIWLHYCYIHELDARVTG